MKITSTRIVNHNLGYIIEAFVKEKGWIVIVETSYQDKALAYSIKRLLSDNELTEEFKLINDNLIKNNERNN